MMKKLFLGFLVAIALGACSSEENEPEGAIVLTGGTQTSQTIYADETQSRKVLNSPPQSLGRQP